MTLDISATKNHKPINDPLFPFHVGVIHDLPLHTNYSISDECGK